MRDEVFEYRPTRTKEAARRWVREVLVLVVLCSGFMFFRYRDLYEALGTDLFVSLMFGAPMAIALWAVYRVLRFALNR